MNSTDITTILTSYTGSLSAMAIVIVPAVLAFGVGIWGLSFAIRKAYRYMRGI